MLAIGCLTSSIIQYDLGVFPAIAGVAKLAWVAGSVVLAISLKRAGRVPTAVSVAGPALAH